MTSSRSSPFDIQNGERGRKREYGEEEMEGGWNKEICGWQRWKLRSSPVGGRKRRWTRPDKKSWSPFFKILMEVPTLKIRSLQSWHKSSCVNNVYLCTVVVSSYVYVLSGSSGVNLTKMQIVLVKILGRWLQFFCTFYILCYMDGTAKGIVTPYILLHRKNRKVTRSPEFLFSVSSKGSVLKTQRCKT